MRGRNRVGLLAWQHVLELARRVVGVEDRKAAPQTGFRVLDLQQLQAQRVEGADRQPLRAVAADALGDALAHFLCRLVGEGDRGDAPGRMAARSEEHTSELQSLMRISYAVFCFKK